ncbi:MAG: hypothetical protein M3O70_02205 [Actinomycetota bacterium]|nr:hypothetical protein [Actinomycetota bacterium]
MPENVELRQGHATATGLVPGSLDVAVMRHVLPDNGGQEQAIVDHLASLVRPGDSVYVVVDFTAIRILDVDRPSTTSSTRWCPLKRCGGGADRCNEVPEEH